MLRRVKYFRPLTARLLFYNNLILPIFDYADVVWGDKNNVSIINDLQVLQNKAAKIILDRAFHSSVTSALATLNRLNLEQQRFYHRCIYVYKCINGLMKHSMKLLTNSDIHNYYTRNNDKTPECTTKSGQAKSLLPINEELELFG